RTEGAFARAGDRQAAHLVVGRDRGQAGAEELDVLRLERVVPVGPVQRDARHRALEREQDRSVGEGGGDHRSRSTGSRGCGGVAGASLPPRGFLMLRLFGAEPRERASWDTFVTSWSATTSTSTRGRWWRRPGRTSGI